MADARGFKRDEFVAKVVKDPKQPPNAIVLSGYLGASSEDGHTRLYLDPSLIRYVDVPDASILHAEEMPKDRSPLGGYTVWIDRNADLVPRGAAGKMKASFLEGPLVAGMTFAPGAGATGTGTLQYPLTLGPTLYTCCPSALPCQSVAHPCLSLLHPCHSLPGHCPTVSPPCISVAHPCLSLLQPCHSLPAPCPTVLRPCQSVAHPCLSLAQPCHSIRLPQCPSLLECPSTPGFCYSLNHPCPSVPAHLCQSLVAVVCNSTTPVCFMPSYQAPCPTQPGHCPTLGPCPSI